MRKIQIEFGKKTKNKTTTTKIQQQQQHIRLCFFIVFCFSAHRSVVVVDVVLVYINPC
jgi:hypothetical protein